VRHFSGYLCIDEVHDGPYSIFYAVDPIWRKRIAFQISDSASKAECLRFLRSLRGLKVRGVTTDGFGLYRHALQEAFGPIRHQVCLFHILHQFNESVLWVLARFRRALPRPPTRRKGPPRPDDVPFADHPSTRLKRTIWNHRFLWTRRHVTAAQHRFIQRLGRPYPLLAALRSFTEELHRLYDRRCRRATAQLKLQRLRAHRMFDRFPELEAIRRQIGSPNLEKSLEFLDDPQLAATNNAVERENRRHRKRQKSIYRARTRETIAARIRFSMMLDLHTDYPRHGSGLKTLPQRKAG
jgi:IS1 family transposase